MVTEETLTFTQEEISKWAGKGNGKVSAVEYNEENFNHYNYTSQEWSDRRRGNN